ncbi:MAG: polyphosphate kinase 2 [Pseudomonadota bacterium]
MALKGKDYRALLAPLTQELVGMARWARTTDARVVVLFEGRDTAGKGGAIRAVRDKLNPRQCYTVALGKPTEDQQTQWYYQRYIRHLPSAGQIALFDRSWYNRAGVEKVMGFADQDQVDRFLVQTPIFEKMLIDDGIWLFKYWLTTDQDKQEARLRERLDDPLKRWKLSPVDLAAREQYDAYTEAREAMLGATHTPHAPWTLVDFNDQKRGRLTLIRNLLDRLPDTHVDPPAIPFPDLDRKPKAESYAMMKPISAYPI